MPARVYARRDAATPTCAAADDACIREVASARTALPPRSLGTMSRRERNARRERVTLASFPKRWRALAGPAGAVAVLPLTPFRVVQSCRPALADIIGARLAWTVAMISSVSMPCR
jgi:hypothetical protein